MDTLEEYRAQIASWSSNLLAERWVAEHKGEVVANSGLFGWYSGATFHFASIDVDPEHWGQGIGSQMYDHLIERAHTNGVKRLLSEIHERHTESLEFALRRGFTRTGHGERLSRLDIRTANLDGYVGIEERLRDDGIRIVTLAEHGTEDETFMRALYDMDTASHSDVPGSEPFVPLPYDDWKRRAVFGPGRSPEWTWVALDGDRPVGLARLQRKGENNAFNAYTGVDRAYRGRGIARALKLRTVEWSRENGVDYHYTGNDTENSRMLAINISLGYQPLGAMIEVARDL